MCICHQKTVIAYQDALSPFSCAIDGGILANLTVIAHHSPLEWLPEPGAFDAG